MCKKILSSLLFLFFLSGCVPQNINANHKGEEQEKSEFLMIQAKNYNGLIDLYTSQLLQNEIDNETRDNLRFKLANVYFSAGDAEAALFQLELLPESSANTKERYLLQAKAQYKESKYEAAQISLDKAFILDERYAEAYNFQGVLFTEQGMLYDARKSFSIARQNAFDDASVRNNLAMLDILEGDFNSALKILLPIFQSGQADDMIKANMVLIYAKLNKFNEFRSMLGEKLSNEEVFERFQLMHNLEVEKTARVDVNGAKDTKDTTPDTFFKNRDGVLIVPNNDASKFYDTIKENEVNLGVASPDSLEYMLNNNLLFPDVVIDNEVNSRSIDSQLARGYKQEKSLESELPLEELEETQILGMTYDFKNNTHRFFIVFSSEALNYNSFDLLAGDQWVVDIQGAFKNPHNSIYKFDNELVEQSAISVYTDFVRVIFKMKNNTSTAPLLTTNNNTLIVEWKSV